jgi:hypothetical protein
MGGPGGVGWVLRNDTRVRSATGARYGTPPSGGSPGGGMGALASWHQLYVPEGAGGGRRWLNARKSLITYVGLVGHSVRA